MKLPCGAGHVSLGGPTRQVCCRLPVCAVPCRCCRLCTVAADTELRTRSKVLHGASERDGATIEDYHRDHCRHRCMCKMFPWDCWLLACGVAVEATRWCLVTGVRGSAVCVCCCIVWSLGTVQVNEPPAPVGSSVAVAESIPLASTIFASIPSNDPDTGAVATYSFQDGNAGGR
jgi:hypothetical protein